MLLKVKNNLKDYFSSGPKAVFVTVLTLICILTVFISLRKTVYITVDGKQMHIVTYRSSVKSILHDNNIAVGSKDKLVPKIDSRVKNGDKIVLKRAVDVAIMVDGKKIKTESAEGTVGKMLTAEKISFDSDDKIIPSLNSYLKNGMCVVITRVDSRIIKEVRPVDFATITKQDDNLESGKNTVIQEGQAGMHEITAKVIFQNGKEISNKILSDVIVKNPVNKIVAEGTLNSISLSRGGTLHYTKSLSARVTAYSADYASTGKNPGDYGFGITATGTRARRNVDGYSSVAVDPSFIPLGAKIYIPGYGYAIAEDTGSAVRGNTIDLYFDSESEVSNWGARVLNIYIVK